MISIPSHVQSLEPYKPGKSSDPSDFARYRAILSSNENNYGPSPLAMSAIREAVSNIHLYPDPQGDRLITKLSDFHSRQRTEFVLSNGLDGLLNTLFRTFTSPGDEVLTHDNSFVAFNKFAAMYNVNVARVPNVDYHFDLSKIVEYISEKTKMVYICNPNNPTGAGVTDKLLREVLHSLPSNILIVVDEAYFQYARHIDVNFPDSSGYALDNVLTLRTFSKLYGLAGVRIGYAIGHERVIEALRKVELVFNPNSLAQIAALAAMDDKIHAQTTLENNKLWISKISKLLKSKGIKYVDSYANFICTVFPSAEEASRFNLYMDEAGILLRGLSAFGMPEGVRISIGRHEEMEYFSEVLKRF